MATHYRTVRTREGFVGYVASERGLLRVYLPEKSLDALKRSIARDYADAEASHDLLDEFANDLQRYFEGEAVEFDVRLDWSGRNAFEIDVWRACRRIPYGDTDSYGGLADQLGRPGAARAVGTAMAHNPFPIVVPCHRVLKSDGSLGGYSGPGGVEFKRHLLDVERTAHCENVM
jgi:methylated-DNA-[protein]-cysteine S-methyltransferase